MNAPTSSATAEKPSAELDVEREISKLVGSQIPKPSPRVPDDVELSGHQSHAWLQIRLMGSKG
jgi:hypothetical protein